MMTWWTSGWKNSCKCRFSHNTFQSCPRNFSEFFAWDGDQQHKLSQVLCSLDTKTTDRQPQNQNEFCQRHWGRRILVQNRYWRWDLGGLRVCQHLQNSSQWNWYITLLQTRQSNFVCEQSHGNGLLGCQEHLTRSFYGTWSDNYQFWSLPWNVEKITKGNPKQVLWSSVNWCFVCAWQCSPTHSLKNIWTTART